MKLESVAIIVVYNDFLKGEIGLLQHLQKIAARLASIGYDLKRISILQENERSLAVDINLFSKLHDVIIIIANMQTQCVNQALANVTSQELIKFSDLESSKGNVISMWPKPSKLLKSKNNSILPVVYLQRMFVLHIESLDDQLNAILSDHLEHYQKEAVHSKQFSVVVNGTRKHIENLRNEELTITSEITNIDNKEPSVYTLTAKNFEKIVSAEKILRNILGSDVLSSNWVNHMSDLIYQSNDKNIQSSIEIIEKCLEDYGSDNVFLSFNGGKDCTVLLHLVQTVLQKKYPHRIGKNKLFCLYVRSDNAFKEQDEFIEQCMIFYNLEIMSIATDIKEALQITLSKKPHLKACLMGTRRTDPFCSHLTAFQMTDSDWPQIMRCSPFLDWHYSDIWDYLLYYKVPYCKLYDYGFTSLGNSTNTIRNPSLIFNEDNDTKTYLPAYRMLNEQKERSGRHASKI